MKRFMGVAVPKTTKKPKQIEEADNPGIVALKKQQVKQEILQRQGVRHLNVINQHPRDFQIVFVEDGHYYHDHLHRRFRLSVTAFKGLFTVPFDPKEAINSKFQNPEWSYAKRAFVVGISDKARYLPEDYGLTREECYHKMRSKSAFGTKMHNQIEKYLVRQGVDNFLGASDEFRIQQIIQKDAPEEELRCAKQVLLAENDYHSKGWKPEKVEWSIFSKRLDVAGQIDLLLSRINDKGEKEYCVLDWKTTEKDIKVPFNYKIRYLPHPNTHVPNCLESEYCLQTSLYSWILINEYNINVVEIWAVVLNPAKPLGTTVKHKPWLREVENMIKVWEGHLLREKIIDKWENQEHSHPLLPRMPRPLSY
jgi:hypothetical protein